MLRRRRLIYGRRRFLRLRVRLRVRFGIAPPGMLHDGCRFLRLRVRLGIRLRIVHHGFVRGLVLILVAVAIFAVHAHRFRERSVVVALAIAEQITIARQIIEFIRRLEIIVLVVLVVVLVVARIRVDGFVVFVAHRVGRRVLLLLLLIALLIALLLLLRRGHLHRQFLHRSRLLLLVDPIVRLSPSRHVHVVRALRREHERRVHHHVQSHLIARVSRQRAQRLRFFPASSPVHLGVVRDRQFQRRSPIPRVRAQGHLRDVNVLLVRDDVHANRFPGRDDRAPKLTVHLRARVSRLASRDARCRRSRSRGGGGMDGSSPSSVVSHDRWYH